MVSSIFTGESGFGIGTALHQPVGRACLRIPQRKILHLPDQHSQVAAHRAEHAQSQLGLSFEESQNAFLLHEQDLRRFLRTGLGGVTGRRSESDLSGGIARAKT